VFGGWWYMAYGRWPLAGDLSHDFGRVPIGGRSSSFDHTFHLRNRTGRVLEIETLRPGCGCTAVEASTMSVEPGAYVDIDVQLSLAHAGKKRASIAMIIKDFGVQTIWVEAIGEKQTSVIVQQPFLVLDPTQPTPLQFMVELQGTDDEPEQPAVSVPDGVTASRVTWAPVRARSRDLPARWRGRVELTLDEPPLARGSEVRITLPPAVPVVIPVTVRKESAESPG